MQTKDKISLAFTGLLVVCALVVTGLVVRQQFFPTSPKPKLKNRTVEDWQNLKLNGARSGPADAPVQIVEFFDYQCPFCKQAQPAVEAIRKKYPQKVAFIQENYPLKMHEHALGAAIAAECARRQHKFMAYHNGLFAHQAKLGKPSFYDSLAVQTGVENQGAFHQCVDTRKTARVVYAGKTLGQKLGVSGIPTFLINGTLVSGALSAQQLDGLVKNALADTDK